MTKIRKFWISREELLDTMASSRPPLTIIDAGNVGGLTAGSIPFAGATGFLTEDNANLFWDAAEANLGIGTNTFGATMTQGIQIATGLAPTANVADTFAFYSADFAAGNACPHFRTENGTVIGLNQSLFTTDSVSFTGITDLAVTATNMAAGTTGQRPGGIVGDIRYNSTLGEFELYIAAWHNMARGGANVVFGTIGCGTITVINGSSINLQEDITFTGATGVNLIKFPDNLPDAFSFMEGANPYQTFVTTNGSEAVVFGKVFSGISGSTIGNLTLADGSITDSGGAISFGDENLSTTGTLGCGIITTSGSGTQTNIFQCTEYWSKVKIIGDSISNAAILELYARDSDNRWQLLMRGTDHATEADDLLFTYYDGSWHDWLRFDMSGGTVILPLNLSVGTTASVYKIETSVPLSDYQIIRAHRDSNSAGHGVWGVSFALDDSGGNITDYAVIGAMIVTNTDGSEDGRMDFFTMKAGTITLQSVIDQVGNKGIGQITFGTHAEKVLAQATGVAPTTSPADCFQMYSADQVAGNACAHFRTENGAIIKLYQCAKADYNNWGAFGDVVDALVAMGIFDAA